MLALRYTKLEDIERVMEIIKQAQQYFKEKGINQWQNGYPNAKVIENDIKNGHSFVLRQIVILSATHKKKLINRIFVIE